MSSNIKGIKVEIGASTDKLTAALKDVTDQSVGLSKELKGVEKALKFDPGNVKLLGQQQKILSEQIEASTKKLETLKGVQDQVEKQFKNGDITAGQYRAFQREVEVTENSLKGLKKKLEDVSKANTDIGKLKKSFEGVGQAAKDAAKEVSTAVGTIGAAVAAGGAAVVAGTQDYNQELARLRTNSYLAGADLGIVEKGFEQITAVTGETDSAVESISNLLASGFKDNQLLGMLDLITGAYIKFSDTLKTEGIADGIQETLATGAAIGQFSELLARSGIDVEKWNEGLAQSKKDGTELNYVYDTLANLGFGEVLKKHKELNPEVTKNAEANAKLQKALADLGLALTPLITEVTKIATKFAKWASDNPELAKTFTVIGAIVGAVAAVFSALSPIVGVLITLFGKISVAIANAGGIMTVLKVALGAITGPIGIVVAAVTGLIAIFVALYKNNESFRNHVNNIWAAVKVAITAAIDKIKGIINTFLRLLQTDWKGAFTAVKNTVTDIMKNIKSVFQNIDLLQIGKDIINGLIKGISSKIKEVGSVVKEIGSSIKNKFTGMFQIKSPSRIFKGYGININEGLAIGLNDSTSLIQKAMDNVYSTLAAGSSLGNSYNTNTNDYSRNMTNNITISANSGNSSRDIERVMRRMAFEF